VASNIQTRPLHKDVGEEMELSPSNPPAVSLQTASNTTTVSIVNPDGTETTIPVELVCLFGLPCVRSLSLDISLDVYYCCWYNILFVQWLIILCSSFYVFKILL